MEKNAYQFLCGFFVASMCYQLCSLAKSPEQVKIPKIAVNEKIPNVQKAVVFKNIEQRVKNERLAKIEVKHLSKPSKYKLSRKGKDFIKSQEKCVLHAYNDPDPKRRSVGWGHQIQPGEKLEHITKAIADELFEKDVEWVNDAINRLIANNDSRFVYTQGFIDGLGSLIYNCGERGVTLTEFWKRWQSCRYDKDQPNYINKNDFNYTIAAVKTSRISAPGHVERRYDEHKLMLN